MGQKNNLRTPKGTYDLTPEVASVKARLEEICEKIYKKHCAVKIETPTFELRENLDDKYGEDTKLIFNLEDQGGDICSLRYDLTVPFSRFISKNLISRIRRYQIGNVFRRDNPSKGRLREFTQADFDITGNNLPMVYDSECIKICSEILTKIVKEFPIFESFKLKINDRRILMGIMEYLEVEEDMQMSICSTVDKYEKLSSYELRKEFELKGLSKSQIDTLQDLFDFSNKNSNENILEKLTEFKNTKITEAVEEMKLLLRYLKIYKVTNFKIDLTLARGLSYYTGIIFEGSFTGVEMGSICGGGRYDELCRSISTFQTPCVGFSIGVSRILNVLPITSNFIVKDCLVGSAYGKLLEERMLLTSKIQEKYNCEMMPGDNLNYKNQIKYAEKNNFKLIIFTGEKELENKTLQIYNLKTNDKKVINECDLFKELKNILQY